MFIGSQFELEIKKKKKNNNFQSTATKNPEYIAQAVTILGELLSRGSALGTTYSADEIEAAPLAAILEVKVKHCHKLGISHCHFHFMILFKISEILVSFR